MPSALTRSLIFAGQKINLHGDLTTPCFYLSQKNEGLFALKIASAQKQFLDGLVSLGVNGAMIQGEVNIDAANVGLVPIGQ
jgi:hypothetical protein